MYITEEQKIMQITLDVPDEMANRTAPNFLTPLHHHVFPQSHDQSDE